MARLLAVIFILTSLVSLVLGISAAEEVSEQAFEHDDECLATDPSGEGCALSALQLRSVKAHEEPPPPADMLPGAGGDDEPPEGFNESNLSAESGYWHGWAQGGDKMWGSGTGIEVVNYGNVGYYDRGMDSARARCGGPGCALIVNPPGARTKDVFHIHFIHYKSYGGNLKRELESKTCSHSGWHHGGPCHGKAAFFRDHGDIFRNALSGGSIHHASLIAWPMSCGGTGTIIELAYGCSVEHQIRGDYNPNYR